MSFFETVTEIDLQIPLWQVGIYIILISFFMLFSRFKLVLLTSCLFTMCWAFILNQDLFSTTSRESLLFMILFIVSSSVLTICSVWTFYKNKNSPEIEEG